MINWGALCFGLVVGWVTYRTLRRTQPTGLSDISTVVGAVGGAAVISLFPQETGAFGAYCVGLAVGFFGYLIAAGIVDVRSASNPGLRSVREWLGASPTAIPPKSDPDRYNVPPPSK